MELTFYQPLLWLLSLVALGIGIAFSLVDRSAPLKWASFCLRALGIVFLVLALCRPAVRRENENLHLVYLLDLSASVDFSAAKDALAIIRDSVTKLERGDSYDLFITANGVRSLGLDELETLLKDWESGITDDEFRSATRISDALLQTRLAFPADKAKRVVLVSDGHPTHGDPEAAFARLAEEKIDVQWLELASLSEPEAVITALEPSASAAFEGEVVRMKVRMAANREMKARLRILHKGVAVQDADINLLPGKENELDLDVEMTTPGDSVWTVELLPETDHFPLNNQSRATVRVRGKPRILVVYEETADMRPFARAMQEQGFDIDVRGGNGLPESMDALLAFDAMILADMPATKLTSRQMALIKRYVIDFGGGLTMLGSENSFGLGGYYRTPVEEVLPLVSRFEKEKEKPSLAMILIIDKSGSMSGLPIALARQAAKSSVELLGSRDQIGVIGFDSNPQIICELRPASERDVIQSLIDSLEAGGGTNLYPAMVSAKEMLDNAATKVKHMIVLSDGQTGGADFQGLTQNMVDSGITVSTVALGQGAARDLMASIAEIGRGRYYETTDPNTVPQIFTKETMQASKSAIKEDLYGTVQTGDHPLMAGFEEADLPFSLGYIMTEPKPMSKVLLAAETGDPLLAISRFGLGTGMAYTSDLTERWGGEWLAWEEFGSFWAQAFRSIIRKTDGDGMRVTTESDDQKWKIRIHRRESDLTPVTGIQWDAQGLDENGNVFPVTVNESGLGHYEAEVPLDGHERLSLRLHDKAHDKIKVLHYHQAYPEEYRLDDHVPKTLQGAKRFTVDKQGDEVITIRSRHSVAHWFYFAAMVCLIGGVLLRRV